MSKRKLKLTVNGKPYNVEVGNLSESPFTVTVNGQAFVVEISSTEETGLAAPTVPATIARTVAAMPAPSSATPAASANVITAPMPGLILNVYVKAGDQINAGQEVCSLEAMKMKNAIRAARAGVVASVAVQEGQKVAYGQTLITLE
jgi:biotin carboxyl carrier protein